MYLKGDKCFQNPIWILRAHRLGRRDQVPQPESRHGVALGEAVEHEGPVAHLERRGYARPVVEQSVVDLVRDERGPELRQRAQGLAVLHGAGGIGGRVDQDGARARRNRGAHGVRVEPVALAGIAGGLRCWGPPLR